MCIYGSETWLGNEDLGILRFSDWTDTKIPVWHQVSPSQYYPIFTTSLSPWTGVKRNFTDCVTIWLETALSDVHLWNVESDPNTIMTLNGEETLCLNG